MNFYSIEDDVRSAAKDLSEGRISYEEFTERTKPAKETPATIARLVPQDASTTPKLKGKGVVEGVDDTIFYRSMMGSDIFSAEFKEEAMVADIVKECFRSAWRK